MWKLAFLATCALAAPATAQQGTPLSGNRIEVVETGGRITRFTGAELKLCDVQQGARANIEISSRDRRTKATLSGMRLCTAAEPPQLTLSATQCVISGMTVSISLSQSCN